MPAINPCLSARAGGSKANKNRPAGAGQSAATTRAGSIFVGRAWGQRPLEKIMMDWEITAYGQARETHFNSRYRDELKGLENIQVKQESGCREKERLSCLAFLWCLNGVNALRTTWDD